MLEDASVLERPNCQDSPKLTPVSWAAVHIYLCDDSPKDYKERYNGQTFMTVALRQQMIDALYQVHGIPVIRVTRVKGKGETNPKSANLNNCLKQIYGNAIPPESEVVAVFDADQAAHSHFFTATLPWMDAGDDVALVQSPQVINQCFLFLLLSISSVYPQAAIFSSSCCPLCCALSSSLLLCRVWTLDTALPLCSHRRWDTDVLPLLFFFLVSCSFMTQAFPCSAYAF